MSEPKKGLGNPRWARYHVVVSAPELWNRDAVAKALEIARAEREERRQ